MRAVPVYCSPQGMVAVVTRRVSSAPRRHGLLGRAPAGGRAPQSAPRAGMHRLTGALARGRGRQLGARLSTTWSISPAAS